jgi:hypothetical protein
MVNLPKYDSASSPPRKRADPNSLKTRLCRLLPYGSGHAPANATRPTVDWDKLEGPA